MNKLVRGLLSGASLVTLQLCAGGIARAAGTTISGAHGAITNPAGSSLDFILVNGATITGDLTNEGTVGPGNSFGIEVENSTISGAVINAATGVIAATNIGIVVDSNAAVSGGIENFGKILLSNVTATGGDESAKAIAYYSNSVAHVTNTGTMDVNVKVDAATNDYAWARAAGVYEYAGGTSAAVDEAFAGTGGAIALKAKATASSEYAEAYAYAESAVRQYADDATAISQVISNSGTVSLTANAKANASSGSASASAFAGGVFAQDAYYAGGKTKQAITNSGAITLAAVATAIGGSSAKASAQAAKMFYQSAEFGDAIGQVVTNSGTLSATAAAKAVANFGDDEYVTAYATVSKMFGQYAEYASKINQSITNSGSLNLVAKARATAVSERYLSPRAYIDDVMYQDAQDTGAVKQSITNSGDMTLSATAKAVANGTNSEVYALAKVYDIFYQDAEASSSTSSPGTVTQKITNSGNISISLTANAQRAAASATRGDTARISANDLFYQSGDGADVTQSITNSGDLTIAGKATATGAQGNIRAYANQGQLFLQDASAENSAILSIKNSGNVAVSMTAAATGADAYAHAVAGTAVGQFASGSADLSETISNSGDIAIAMAAAAKGGYVDATANLQTAIKQRANDGTDITQSITNSGSFAFSLAAKADGSLGTVEAAARGAGFTQTARGVGTINQAITNSGTLSFDFSAVAMNAGTTENARATAKMFTALEQVGHYTGATTDNVGEIAQAMTNSGTLALTLSANAKGGRDAYAYAIGSDVFLSQKADAAGVVSEAMTNSGSILIQQIAKASGAANQNNAEAWSRGILEQSSGQTGNPDDTSSLTATNLGTISFAANASAVAEGSEKAYAEAGNNALLQQYAYNAGSVTETIANSGTIDVVDSAKASGSSTSYSSADAYGELVFDQYARDIADATLSITNSNAIAMSVLAAAAGTLAAYAYAGASLGYQEIQRNNLEGDIQGILSVTNSGDIGVLASADATAGSYAYAQAHATGFKQNISEFAGTEEFDNSGTLSLTAVATLKAEAAGAGTAKEELPYARAHAVAVSMKAYGQSGVFLYDGSAETVANSAPLTLSVTNSGTLQVAATANGSAMDAANIWATATGLRVQASSETGYSRVYFSGSHSRYETTVYHDAGGTVGGTIDNSGSLLVSASAPGGEASAYGIKITANANSVDIANHSGGRIGADATGATAVAVGIFEGGEWSATRYHYLSHFGTTAKNYVETYQGQHTNAQGAATAVTGDITNSGTISVSATASGANIGDGSSGGIAALGLSAAPHARAEGIRVNAMTMSGAIQNSGAIDVTASGSGAIANGIHVLASRTGTASGYTEIYKYRGTASGYQWTTVSVSTPFHTAVLEGSKFSGKVSNSGTISVSAKGGGAKATGVLIEDEEFDGSFRNTGTIAAVATGTDASAVGVEIDASTLGSHASFVNDGGTISALTNGAYGTAIDVSGAPSSLVLALNGGRITGNIVENAAGNAITIGSGNLVLDGLVNPSKAKLGSLTVGSHGTLTLANDTRGNGTAYVNSFVQNGTLAITGAQNGASGSIHAGSATLSGAAIVNLDLSSGTPYDTSTVYKVVFSDSALSGTWSTVSASAATTFFSAAGQYSANEADIVLSRATFDSIAGLTPNEQSVAHAIETIYEGGTTGTITDLLNAILNLSPAQYPEALDALSGESAGELSAVDQSSAQNFLDLITSHLGDPSTGGDTTASLLSGSNVLAANVAPTDVSPAQLSDLSGTKAWGGGFQYGSSVDATASGPGYSSHQSGILAGVDVPLSRNALFGVAASYGTGDIKTDKLLGFGTFSAAQFAGYGRFMADNGLYGMGEVSYGSFTNKLNRYVSIPGFGSGMLHGKFDSTAWGLYGEAGWRFEMDAARVTPYAAISYLDADSDGYTEAGSFPVPLTVKGSTSKATSSYLGLKLATDWQLAPATITPRLTAAWQHDYTKNAWEMSAAFTAVPTVGFGLNGSDLSRDFAYVDGGFTLHISNEVDVLLDYQGRFSSDRSDNAFLARANVRF